MISIIGGGPAGCYTAYLLAKAGKKASVFEEHSEIGKPVQCTGIVTSSINNIIKIKKGVVINKISKVRISAGKKSLEVRLKNKNLVIDRQKFDSSLAEKAENAGAKIYLSHKYIGNTGKQRKKVITIDNCIHAIIPNMLIFDYF